MRPHAAGVPVFVLLVSFLLVGACGPSQAAPAAPTASSGQSYADALKLICDVDQRAGIDADADLLDAEAKRQDFIAAEVKHPDAIELRTLLTPKPPADKARLLRAEATGVGLSRCALADQWSLDASSE